MSRLTRDGTAEPASRDQILRHERGQGNIHFPCSADHGQDWQPYPVDHIAIFVTISYMYRFTMYGQPSTFEAVRGRTFTQRTAVHYSTVQSHVQYVYTAITNVQRTSMLLYYCFPVLSVPDGSSRKRKANQVLCAVRYLCSNTS